MSGGGGGGLVGNDRRTEVFVKIPNWGGGGVVGLVGGGGQGGCERRIEVFVKIQKKKFWGGGVRVDVNEELKFL